MTTIRQFSVAVTRQHHHHLNTLAVTAFVARERQSVATLHAVCTPVVYLRRKDLLAIDETRDFTPHYHGGVWQ